MKSLSPRLKQILELVVRDYIRTAEPVGSEALVSRHKLDLSSATIRKIMAELEERGLLARSHSSAGRAPTEAGLSTYVNEILEADGLSREMRALIDRQLAGREAGAGSVLSLCSRVLSNITKHMGVVIAPTLSRLALKQIYFVRLAADQVLAVLVDRRSLVRNRLISVAHDHSQDQLNQVNAYLAGLGANLTLNDMKNKILSVMKEEKNRFNSLYAQALELSSQALAAEKDEAGQPIYLEGRDKLLDNPEFAAIESMKGLFKAFEDKSRIVELLNEVADEGRVRIVVGPAAAAAALDGLALVASPYARGDRTLGAVGIIGPQRLDYAGVVPVVDYAARVVGELLDA